MKKVFIAGPLKIRTLDNNIKERLDNIIRNKIEVLIGDANGIDAAVQEYLFMKQYNNVTVYCINNPRNNIGNWKIKSIPCEGTISFSDYVKKDNAMAHDTDFGFMIWNGKSNGTLNNTLNLLEQGKKTRLYFKPARNFYTIVKLKDFEELLSHCDKEDLTKIDKKIRLYERVNVLSQGSLFEMQDETMSEEKDDNLLLALEKEHYGVSGE
ncbi:hypothetical protein KAT51_06980 [bacterium]|nr:hypothetical protein [bacterium]